MSTKASVLTSRGTYSFTGPVADRASLGTGRASDDACSHPLGPRLELVGDPHLVSDSVRVKLS
eukprot:scaffold9998_cov63-Phaeocystis_antarctica.AAC.4